MATIETLVELALKFREQVLKRDAATLGRLTKAYTLIYRRTNKDLENLINKILAGGKPMSPGQIQQLAQYKDLINHLQEETARFGVYLQTTVSTEAEELIKQAGMNARMLIARATGDNAEINAMIRMLDPGAVENLLGFLDPQSTIWKYWEDKKSGLGDKVRDTILENVSLGRNPRVWADALRGAVGMPLESALRTARTLQLWSYREASRANYAANSDIVPKWQWVAQLDDATCPACISLHGKIFDLQEPTDGHWNCLIPGALVHAPFAEASTSRFYDGDVITIHISSGQFLTVTPNHPILTRRGWIGAQFIHEGDDVFCYSDTDWASVFIGPDKNNIPSIIEDFAGTHRMNGFCNVPTAPEDFHGDGQSGYTKVNVINSDSFLTNKGDGKNVGESILVDGGPGTNAEFFSGYGSLIHALDAWRLAPYRVVGGGYLSHTLMLSHTRPLDCFGFGLITNMDTLHEQTPSYNISPDTEKLSKLQFALSVDISGGHGTRNVIKNDPIVLATNDSVPLLLTSELPLPFEFLKDSLVRSVPSGGNGLDAVAGNVITNSVVKIERGRFSGHVYNLQTKNGWYSANTIITHNCRCTLIPVTILTKDAGLSRVSGYRSTGEPITEKYANGEEWFGTLSEADQKSILGPGKYQAWKDGNFEFSQLARHGDDAILGGMWSETPLKDLVPQS